ncbi:hypothetical protein N7532_000391 [Penicillium argentinense]|uniref:Beta-xylanase n=1 Tax=Penicillium argentinense TaxID=1131581 RepID=A0A9W9G571_9EURO|nr:uncharacterized protein N7532_000391 [Penicillium argentinense]KAJ5112346.1 hypothetical protein N7532_000391 [Penicillium argentinense]
MQIFNNSRIFGQTTSGNTMKWEFVEPSKNSFSFAGGDDMIALANATGKKVRCHNLVWSEELPSWVSSGSWTNETLLAVLEHHISKVVRHYGENFFLETISESYIPLVQSLNADIKLFYNDYGIENPGARHSAAVKLAKKIQSWPGAHIDGIGFESHFSTSWPPTKMQQLQAMSAFTELGLQVQVTELDVACSAVPCSRSDLATQAKAYFDTVSACVEMEDCTGITVWDLMINIVGFSRVRMMEKGRLVCFLVIWGGTLRTQLLSRR